MIDFPGNRTAWNAQSLEIAVGSALTASVEREEGWVFDGIVSGAGTTVDATFSPGGSLRLEEVEDGALVRYRPEHRADPQLRVTPGRVTGGAAVREEAPPR